MLQEIETLIEETTAWRLFHRDQRLRGVKGAGLESLACDIRETALRHALAVIKKYEKNYSQSAT